MLKQIFLLLLLLLFIISNSYAQGWEEKSVINLAKSSPTPDLLSIEASFLQAKAEEQKLNDLFRATLKAGTSHQETNERAIIQFQPIFTPIKQNYLELSQQFQGGVKAKASISTDQRSAMSSFSGTFVNATTTTLAFNLEFDLWKDFLGRLSQAQTNSAKLQRKRALLESEINQANFVLAVRRIYWALVANNESLQISRELKVMAQKQYRDAKKRLANSISDKAEVARYQAQLYSRESGITYLEYQRELLIKELTNLIPQIGESEFQLGEYDLDKTVAEVLSCTAKIGASSSIPWSDTDWDDVVKLLKEFQHEQVKLAQSYSDIDLKLIGGVQAVGVGSIEERSNYRRGSYQDSWDDINNTNRTGYNVGLSLTIPLGSERAKTEKTQEKLAKKRVEAQILRTQSQIQSTHKQLIKSIRMLTNMVRSQKLNSKALKLRVNEMNKKFSQARVSVNDLINDQDAQLNSNLAVIDTQLQVLNTLFDYLSVFTKTQCTFNRI